MIEQILKIGKECPAREIDELVKERHGEILK